MLSSTAMVNLGVTNPVGEKPAVNSTIVSDSLSNSIFDQTQNDLRNAIVGNLIKNPKTFKGGKDDVKKWIEGIEHLFELAHIPESTRLDLVSYSLRGDASEWFKNNKTTFTSWNVFVIELKKAFTSSFHEELAFIRLESYSQGENQLIHSFFNEILKLCKGADNTMSEVTKLKNLLNKTKPNIQFEVRKKKPTLTAEFLVYAKEAEELMQLSNMTTDSPNSQKSTQAASQRVTLPLSSTPTSTINQSLGNKSNNSWSNFPELSITIIDLQIVDILIQKLTFRQIHSLSRIGISLDIIIILRDSILRSIRINLLIKVVQVFNHLKTIHQVAPILLPVLQMLLIQYIHPHLLNHYKKHLHLHLVIDVTNLDMRLRPVQVSETGDIE